jgi:Kef-type K+ transport system membrane component KefB
MTTLLPVLALVLISGRFMARLATRLRLPGLFGELVLGLAIGPLIVRWLGDASTFGVLGNLGVLLLMFLAGLETDLDAFRKVGVPAFLIACVGAAVPFATGAVLARWIGLPLSTALFVGVALSATSVSITAATLRDRGKLQSRAGSAILLAAVIDDVVGLLLLTFVTGNDGGQSTVISLVRVGAVFALTVVSAVLIKPLLRLLESHVEGFLALGVGVAFLFAWGMQTLGGIAPITGAYIAGLLLAHSLPHQPLAHGVETMASGFFATIFFVSLGLNVRFESVSLPLMGIFVALAVLTKVVGCGLAAKISRLTWAESLVVGVGMIPRGEVALVVASLGLQLGILPTGIFSVLVLVTAATTVITPVLLNGVYALVDPRDAVTQGEQHPQTQVDSFGPADRLTASVIGSETSGPALVPEGGLN